MYMYKGFDHQEKHDMLPFHLGAFQELRLNVSGIPGSELQFIIDNPDRAKKEKYSFQVEIANLSENDTITLSVAQFGEDMVALYGSQNITVYWSPTPSRDVEKHLAAFLSLEEPRDLCGTAHEQVVLLRNLARRLFTHIASECFDHFVLSSQWSDDPIDPDFFERAVRWHLGSYSDPISTEIKL